MKHLLTAVAVACTFMAKAQTNERDINFAKKASMDGLMEVRLGEMAQTHATTPQVKEEAQHMVNDHRLANEELKDIAVRKNIAVPVALNSEMQEKYNKLSKLNGKDFDRKYSKCMVKDHKKAICLFKKEARKGKDAEMKTWASAKIPTLESHLRMWKDARKAAKM